MRRLYDSLEKMKLKQKEMLLQQQRSAIQTQFTKGPVNSQKENFNRNGNAYMPHTRNHSRLMQQTLPSTME